jgi:hypothetical protein
MTESIIGKLVRPHNGYIIGDLCIRRVVESGNHIRPRNLIWGTVGPTTLPGGEVVFGRGKSSRIRCKDCGKRSNPALLFRGRCNQCYEEHKAKYPPLEELARSAGNVGPECPVWDRIR